MPTSLIQLHLCSASGCHTPARLFKWALCGAEIPDKRRRNSRPAFTAAITWLSQRSTCSPKLSLNQQRTSSDHHIRYLLLGSVTGGGNPPGPRLPATSNRMLSRVRPVLAAMSDMDRRPISASRTTFTPSTDSTSAMAVNTASSNVSATRPKSRYWMPSVLPTSASSHPSSNSASITPSSCKSGPSTIMVNSCSGISISHFPTRACIDSLRDGDGGQSSPSFEVLTRSRPGNRTDWPRSSA